MSEVLSSLHETHALGTASEVVFNLFEQSLNSISNKSEGNSRTGAVEVLHMLCELKQ